MTLGKVSTELLWGVLSNSHFLSPDMPLQVKTGQRMSRLQSVLGSLEMRGVI